MFEEPARISITFNRVTKRFGALPALDACSAEFEPANLHGVIGPDGAGKTTLMRLLAGLLTPTDGRIITTSGGTVVPFKSIQPGIAYMPSKASLYPDLSIEEHLLFFKDLYSLSEALFREKSERLLSITRLEKFKTRTVGNLSGGMYKKLGLMCALLADPAVLLLDEPTNGVDPISRREFWNLLYQLLDEGILIIIATAYMDEAERCTRVHFLEQGRHIASGEPAAVLKEKNISSFTELFTQ